jgi:carboxypeptidase Taq
LKNWLSETLYVHGRKFLPPELSLRVTGKPLSAAPYLNYLRGKYGEIYGLA